MQVEYNSSEGETDDEENYLWYRDTDPDSYFTLCTKHKTYFEKDTQLYHCYGRRNNRYLIANYGFCLGHNKYNSLAFKVWLDFNKKSEDKKPTNINDLEEDDNRISKIIKLKPHMIREELFAYLRTSIM